jgi:hypothetical protein
LRHPDPATTNTLAELSLPDSIQQSRELHDARAIRLRRCRSGPENIAFKSGLSRSVCVRADPFFSAPSQGSAERKAIININEIRTALSVRYCELLFPIGET